MSIFSKIKTSIRFYWQLATQSAQKVFRYLQWFKKTYIHAFPCLDTIAKACDCSRRTVSRALAFLEEREWIKRIKRPYQSNMYEVAPELLDFDTTDNNNFKVESPPPDPSPLPSGVPNDVQQSVPVNDPVLKSSSSSQSKSTCTEVPDMGSEKKEEPKIHNCVKIQCLSEEQQAELSAQFAEVHLANAIDDVKWYSISKKNKVRDYFKLIRSRAWASFKRYKEVRAK